jgi:hypothetical protein
MEDPSELDRIASNLRQEKFQLFYLALDIAQKSVGSDYLNQSDIFAIYEKLKKEIYPA